MSTTFFFSGHKYELKSGMLYMGNGEGGHWRCIVQQKEDRLVIFDDEKEPVTGSSEVWYVSP